MFCVTEKTKPIKFMRDTPNFFVNYYTEWIKYMWSKKEILPHIREKVKWLNIKTVLDWFAGTTRVWQFFNNNGYCVCSNDLNIWSEVFWKTFLLNTFENRPRYQEKIDYLNSLKWKDWFYTMNYWWIDNNWSSVQSDWKKRLWQVHNTKKLDAIRDEIDNISESEIEKATLLTSLIFALDKVDSSLWHFSSYLKWRSARSYKTMKLEVPHFFDKVEGNSVVTWDVFNLINHNFDLAYFDPPYWSNNDKMPSSRVRYGQYYHIRETIIRHDKPKTIWAINKRSDATVERTYSIFEDYNKKWNFYVPELAVFSLIEETKAAYILFSYNTNWRAEVRNIINFLNKKWYQYELTNIWYKKNVMAWMKWTYDRDNLWERENHEILLLIYK